MRLIFILLLAIPFATTAQHEYGQASFYANKFEGLKTASGEKYHHHRLTAAHRTLPFGTQVKITNLANNKSVIVKVNDRGPFVKGRIIDLSRSAAKKLEFINQGTAEVKLEIIDFKERPVIENAVAVKAKKMKLNEYYSIKLNKVQRRGYGVQIGNYTILKNTIAEANKLSLEYNDSLTIKLKLLQSAGTYSLIIGEFKTRDQAKSLKANLQNDYPDCFIFKF